MLGKKNNSIILAISLNKKGRTPLNVSDILTSPAILLMIKTLRPTGGVINPTSTVIRVNIPNHIAVSSGDIPKSKVITNGKKTGMVNRIIAKLSIRHPKNKYKIKMLPTTIIGVNWCFTVSSAKIFGSWERAIKELKNSAPNKTRKIIPEVIAVLSMTSKKDLKLNYKP